MQQECEQLIYKEFPNANLVYREKRVENVKLGFRDTVQMELYVYTKKYSEDFGDLVLTGKSSRFCTNESVARAEAAAHCVEIHNLNQEYKRR